MYTKRDDARGEQGLVQWNVAVPLELLRAFKVASVTSGKPLQALVVEAITQWLQCHKER